MTIAITIVVSVVVAIIIGLPAWLSAYAALRRDRSPIKRKRQQC
jgi:hypothetical protein